jgi:hypothetical protein
MLERSPRSAASTQKMDGGTRLLQARLIEPAAVWKKGV